MGEEIIYGEVKKDGGYLLFDHPFLCLQLRREKNR